MEHKHHTAAKSASRKSVGGFGTVIFVIASVVLIAIILILSPLGDYLMEHVVTPILSCVSDTKDNEIISALKQQESAHPSAVPTEKPTEKTRQIITLDEKPFYILQMGAFTDQEAADRHSAEIMRMGAGGTVFHDGSIYRVFAAAYDDETSLIKVQSQVRADGFEATPYITESKGLRITLDGDPKAIALINEAVQLLSVIPSDLCALCLSFDKGEINAAELKDRLAEMMEKCKSTSSELEQVKTGEISSIRDLLIKYEQNISTFTEEHDMIDSEMISAFLKHIQLSVIIDYILFFDQE